MLLRFKKLIPTSKQAEDLYSHLRERRHAISHDKMPTYVAHLEFLNSHPYREWLIIELKREYFGNVYLQYDNSVALHTVTELTDSQLLYIIKFINLNFEPMKAIPSVRAGNFFVNVPATDYKLQKKLLRLGLIELQRAYSLQLNSNGEPDV